MITYEEALKRARELKTSITKCVETPTAYMFKNTDDEYSFGGEGICVILKENGKAIGLTAYYDGYAVPGDTREFDV